MEFLESTSSPGSLPYISQPTMPSYFGNHSTTLNGTLYKDGSILKEVSGHKLINNTNDFGQVHLFSSEAVTCWFTLIVRGFLTTAVAMFGILGNILSISVLSKKKMQSSISVLMIGLSVSDLLVCINSTFVIGVNRIIKGLGTDNPESFGTQYLAFLCENQRFIFPWVIVALVSSTYFTVTIAIERYFAVCWPIQCRSYLTRTKTVAVSAFIVLLSFAISCPTFIVYYTKEHEPYDYPTRNCNATESKPSYAKFISYSVFMYTVPLSVVTAMNALILFKVRKMNVRRDTMTPYQRRKIRLTNMLITIVAVYLICNIAKVINEITKLLIGKTFTEIVTVTNFLVTFNSSVNYLIYCAFGRTFRQSFVNLFLKCGNQVCNCSACLSARHQQRNNTTAVDNQTYSDCSNCRSSVSSAPSKLCSTVRTMLFRIKKLVPIGSSRSQIYSVNPD